MHYRLTHTSDMVNKRSRETKDFPTKPKVCFGRTILVRHGDSDWSYRTNQAKYFDFCMDAATEGAKRGHFRLLKGDLLSYRVESMECLYQGKSTPGDELKVYIWENPGKRSELLCQIEKDEEVIWVGKIGFGLHRSIMSKIWWKIIKM